MAVALVLIAVFIGVGIASQSSATLSHEQIVRMNQTLIPITATASGQIYIDAIAASAPCYGSFDTYYNEIIFDPMQDDFFAGLLQQFRMIKEHYHLDDNQYAELMAAYVQAIPYDLNAGVAVKYPVVTAIGGVGDCDDFALLLGGLLAREDYDVNLLLYLNSSHMAVGIRSDNVSYAFPNTGGYAYIETTGGTLIVCGDYPMGMIENSEMPICISIGNGTKVYTAGRESNELFRYIYATYYFDEPGEKEPIVLNPQENLTPSQDMKVFSINAFDRDYLYRNLIVESP